MTRRSGNVAIIDDDAPVRESLKSLLRSMGLGATTFSSAEEFLRAADLEGTDCVITDIYMPGMSGIDLKRHLTGHGFRRPVIMITAMTNSETREAALSSGALSVLVKPFDAAALAAWVGEALGNE